MTVFRKSVHSAHWHVSAHFLTWTDKRRVSSFVKQKPVDMMVSGLTMCLWRWHFCPAVPVCWAVPSHPSHVSSCSLFILSKHSRPCPLNVEQWLPVTLPGSWLGFASLRYWVVLEVLVQSPLICGAPLPTPRSRAEAVSVRDVRTPET